MIKTDVKAYKVVVDKEGAKITLLCVTHKISSIGPHYVAEFHELVTSLDNSAYKFPQANQKLSFAEELRIFSKASLIAPENRVNMEDWISTKMEEGYGDNIKVQVEKFITE